MKKNRKRRVVLPVGEQAENYHRLASDTYVFTDGDDPNYRDKIETAISNLRRAPLIEPENYDFNVLMGNLLDGLDDRSATIQALEYYDRAIGLRPECPDAYDSKAGALLWTNPPDQPEAERLARLAVKLARESNEEPEELQFEYMALLDVLEVRNKLAELRWTILKARKDCPTELMKGVANATLARIAALEAEASKES